MLVDEIHSIYSTFTKYYKHQLQLYNKQLPNKWFIKHFIVNSQITLNQLTNFIVKLYFIYIYHMIMCIIKCYHILNLGVLSVRIKPWQRWSHPQYDLQTDLIQLSWLCQRNKKVLPTITSKDDLLLFLFFNICIYCRS